MTLLDGLQSTSPLTLVARALQGVLLVLVGYGVVSGDPSLVINGVLATAVAFVPLAVERRYDHEVDPLLSVWIGVAAVVHVTGFLGFYSVQSGPLSWYDQFAHGISASFTAGVGYALVVALDRTSTRITIPQGYRVLFVILFIMAFSVSWEILEFTVSSVTAALGDASVLIQYGKDDIVFDLTVNAVAGAVVAVAGGGYFADFTEILTRRLPRRDGQ